MNDPFFSRALAASAIHYTPTLPLAYMNNPKAGCSTIKRSLWLSHDRAVNKSTFAGHPNRRVDDPHIHDLRLLAESGTAAFIGTPLFTAVRNPYVRILSAYLDKVNSRSDNHVWRQFCLRFGIDRQCRVPFRLFVDLITQEPPCMLNNHFAPQHLNIGVLLFDLDFVGRLENVEEISDYMGSYGVELSPHRPHARHTAQKVERYYSTGSTAKKVHGYFIRDFELFGYSESVDDIMETGNVQLPKMGKQFLHCFIDSCRGDVRHGIRCLDAMRADLAPYYWLDYMEFDIRRHRRPDDPASVRSACRRMLTKPNRNWRFYAEVCEYLHRSGLHDEASEFARHAHRAARHTKVQRRALDKLAIAA